MRRQNALGLGVACVLSSSLALACSADTPTDAELEGYRRLRGDLVRAETSSRRPRGRYVVERIRLESTTGLTATGWLMRPAAGGCFAAALLQDGREENSAVIGRLPSDFGELVVLSLDYPTELPYTIELRDLLVHRDALRDGARRIPALFSLGASYLAQRSDVDTTRIALAATSFAVPFAAIAAAADERFRNVALIYGAGDLATVLAANLPTVPRLLRRPIATAAMSSFDAFAPERFIGRIAPRPVVMINGVDDPQIPAEAVRRLYAAAREPKALVWLRTGHLMPTDTALIRSLMDTAFARLPVLHDTGAPPRCSLRPT